jgi:hypothetical protein
VIDPEVHWAEIRNAILVPGLLMSALAASVSPVSGAIGSAHLRIGI